MKYSPYYRIVSGADTAVLFIHGIVGTPAHFKDLVPLVPENWSVYNILLDGHGKQVEHFARTSMAKWKAQVSNQLDEILNTHTKVLIVAHSMGTLFAINEAIKRPGKVKGLFLLAVPLTPRVLPSTAVSSVKVALGLAKEGTPAQAMLDDAGVQLSPKLWKYITWIPRFWELLLECTATKKLLPRLAVPTRVYQSRRDELVSFRSCKYLEEHPCMQLRVLTGSGHFAYGKEDLALLQQDLLQMFISQ